MNSQPLISIITPMFNVEKFVEETIQSVLAQTYTNWEMIFVDDGSSDNSYNIIDDYCKKDSRFSLFKRTRLPKGPGCCRNMAIESAKGDYIVFLDADDLIFPTCLDGRVKIIKEYENLDFCVFQMNLLTADQHFNGRLLTLESEDYLANFIAYNLPWVITCPIWETNFLRNRLKGFNESFIRLEDPELHVRALAVEGVRYKVFPDEKHLDCSYRFFQKTIKLEAWMTSFLQYVNSIYDAVIAKNDNLNKYKNDIVDLYNAIIFKYTSYNEVEMKENLSLMQKLNEFFLSKNLIDKNAYKKTRRFLLYIKYNCYKSYILNFILQRVGFTRFCNYPLPRKSKA